MRFVVPVRAAYVPLFTPDPDVRALLASVLVVGAVFQPVAGVVFALDGILIGAGDGRYLALASRRRVPAASTWMRAPSSMVTNMLFLPGRLYSFAFPYIAYPSGGLAERARGQSNWREPWRLW